SGRAECRSAGPTLIGTGGRSGAVAIPLAGQLGSLDPAPAAVDQPGFDPALSAPPILVPRSAASEFGDEPPTDIFQGQRPKPPATPLDPALAAQPTIILGSAACQPDPVVVIQAQARRAPPPPAPPP